MELAGADRHRAKVARIAAQLRAHPRGTPVSLRKKAVSHQVPKADDLRRHDPKIDVSALTEILSIDPVRRICVAESGVTFVDLVTATLAHGLVPIVVPELKTITIGGAVSGCSIESMSYVHGGFHDTCLAYEVVTAAGDVVVCTPDNEHRLVFQMMHGAFGTLGILTELTFRLIPARPFVKLRYETYPTLAAYQAAILRRFEARDVDFMDGIIHTPTCYVLCLGDFVDAAPYTSDYSWMKIYYQSTRTRTEDYLTTPDYFFRYDRGVTNVRPSSWLGRLAFGKLLASSQWLRLGEKLRWLLREERPTVTLDVFVPFSRVAAFLAWYERELGHYPLWCVPYRRVRDYLLARRARARESALVLVGFSFVFLAVVALRAPLRRLRQFLELAVEDAGAIAAARLAPIAEVQRTAAELAAQVEAILASEGRAAAARRAGP